MPINIQCAEKDIEEYLSKNCKKHLKLRFVSRQIETPAGIIDMLAYDQDNGIWYVIEIKKGCIDSHCLAQILRYSNYMNAKYSKLGKRAFLPLMIGDNLSTDLRMSVFTYKGGWHGKGDFGKIFYTIFQYSLSDGIRFDYHSSPQFEYEQEHLSDFPDFQSYSHEEAYEMGFKDGMASVYMGKSNNFDGVGNG